jgi:hypothetical protein
MEMRKSLILFLVMFFVVAMLVSCASHKRPNYTWPSTFTKSAIRTTMIEVTGDNEEKLKIEFDRSGKCEQSWVNGEVKNCKGIDFNETIFCVPPHGKYQANTDIYNDGEGTLDYYCGDIRHLTDGADIKFKGPSAAGNLKCKNVGGIVICY